MTIDVGLRDSANYEYILVTIRTQGLFLSDRLLSPRRCSVLYYNRLIVGSAYLMSELLYW